MVQEEHKHLAWFLGPKAENAQMLEDVLVSVLRDYVYWRRNYFPGDSSLINYKVQRSLEEEYDLLTNNVDEMMAELRRSFPFYSPRYIAHEQSDTTLPSLIGYIAALLYNPNNVTPEGAPVTVDWEIDACNEILKMLGYTPPPAPPRSTSEVDEYERRIRQEFGWAHITLGGTTANIEALWIARTVRYLPLSVRDVAIQEGLVIQVERTDGAGSSADAGAGPGAGATCDMRTLSEREVLLLKPQQAVSMLALFVDAVRRKYRIPVAEASRKGITLLSASPYSLGKGLGHIFYHHPPVIFVSGAAHYSIRKAADVLGIGRDNVVLVDMDAQFRLDVADLERKITTAMQEGKIPLAVVAIAGTTEEGAVDPIHEVVRLRDKLEMAHGTSFWLHVDAAWCGYLRSLFRDADVILARVSRRLGLNFYSGLDAWHAALRTRVREMLTEDACSETFRLDVLHHLDRLGRWAAAGDPDAFVHDLRTLLLAVLAAHPAFATLTAALSDEDFEPSPADRQALVQEYVGDEMEVRWGAYRKAVPIAWGTPDICAAFGSFSQADSITVDPHKMGYTPYPCGIVAFKSDRVRHFVLQEAPYITSARHNALMHMPPKHVENIMDDPAESRVMIDAFAPFILEGSRPGAAASALRLAIKTVPLTMTKHGAIVRASLLAARELFEWLRQWPSMARGTADAAYDFVPLTEAPPDTNTVIFVVKETDSSSLRAANRLTMAVYDHFTINAELGEREYSYTQPFFLSKTTFREPWYPYATLTPFFKRCGLGNARRDYKAEGLVVLRATVMNPYIQPLRQMGKQNIAREFMRELVSAVSERRGGN